jgi:hypothetical protein
MSAADCVLVVLEDRPAQLLAGYLKKGPGVVPYPCYLDARLHSSLVEI